MNTSAKLQIQHDRSSGKINIKPLSKTSATMSRTAIQLKPRIHSHIQRNLRKNHKTHGGSKIREIRLHSSELVEYGVQLKYYLLFLITYYTGNCVENVVHGLLVDFRVTKHDYFFDLNI